MKYEWTNELVISNKGNYKAIFQDNKEIIRTDYFSEDFIRKIIECHNKSIKDTMDETTDMVMNLLKK